MTDSADRTVHICIAHDTPHVLQDVAGSTRDTHCEVTEVPETISNDHVIRHISKLTFWPWPSTLRWPDIARLGPGAMVRPRSGVKPAGVKPEPEPEPEPKQPAFLDCTHPDDCECAKRGYQHERENCAVPEAAAAAEEFGMNTVSLFKRRALPPLAATVLGTQQPLPNTGDLVEDVLSAIRRVGVECPYSKDELRRVMWREQISRGLREEAGYASSGIVILYSATETLASGATLMWWLTLSPGVSTGGDAVFWMVAVRSQGGHGESAIQCGDKLMFEVVCDTIRRAGGGGVAQMRGWWTDVPSQEELDNIENE